MKFSPDKLIYPLLLALIFSSITGFMEFQAVKADVVKLKKDIGVAYKNNKLICLMAVKITAIEREDIKDFCDPTGVITR